MSWASIKNVKDIVKDGVVGPIKEMVEELGIFSSVSVGENVLAAEGNVDTLPLIAGDNINITLTENGVRFDAVGGGASGTGIKVADVTGASVVLSKNSAQIRWTDPDNVEISGVVLAQWSGTLVVRKVGSAPADRTDGIVVVNSSTKNAYSSTAFVDSGLTYGTTYYYRFFPYTTDGNYTGGSSFNVTPVKEVIASVPAQDGTLEYDGTEQTAIFTGYDPVKMTVSGNTGTDADTYTATFTPLDGYEWSDGTSTGKDVTWVIDKQSVTIPTLNTSVTISYNGSERDAVALGAFNGFDSTIMNVSGHKRTNAGSQAATFTLKDTDNYEWDGNDPTVTWSIAKATQTITPQSASVTLNAANPTAMMGITQTGDGAITATSSDNSVATGVVSGLVLTISSVNDKNGTVTITLNAAETANYKAGSATVAVTASFLSIYGASWDGTSTTAWTRTDDAADFTDPVPYVSGASNYGSPFDSLQPWAGMVKEERTGGTMVKIPKFWYKITQNGAGMKVQIADGPADGFSVSPAHMDRGDGKGERDTVYVGRYHSGSSTRKSKTGETPYNNATRSTMRTQLHNLGSNLWQMDFATRFTLWLLYIVEFADWNSQAKIGYGCGNGSGVQAMGYTDSMPYHTGTTQSSRTSYGLGTQYRYIEGLWDNVYDWLDGCYYNSNGLNIILNPNNFSDSSGGTAVGTPSSGYPSAFTVKDVSGTFNMFIPTAANGSDSTYSCDSWNFVASHPCLFAGGGYNQYLYRGLFYVDYYSVSSSGASLGCRLLELP
ncbi:MAG: hypothetical protein IJT16_08055 [Lachnospiraceae bacterium]|nr:hypothetical protein [Lachnospiraceae bacterium]